MLYVLLALLVGLIILVASVRIHPSGRSRFELERTKQTSVLHRDERVRILLSLQRMFVTLLVLTMGYVSVAVAGWGRGIVLALIVALIYAVIARQKWANTLPQTYYDRFEPRLLRWIDRVPFVFSILAPSEKDTSAHGIESKEHLLHLVKDSHTVLTPDEKSLIKNSLSFGSTQIKDIMQPRAAIASVAAGELLGPVVIDDLHKTGHSRFPVIKGDIDHVIGVLQLRDFLVLDSTKQSVRVDEAMDKQVLTINENDTLSASLEMFLKERSHFAIVVSDEGKTSGVVTIEDIIATLIVFE